MAETIRNLGGLRSAAHVLGYTFLATCGLYRQYQRVNWERVQRLVFVCSGNICRSPYAAELARALGIAAMSFGIDARGGATANESAIRLAKNAGVDLTRHVSTRASDYQATPGDLLLAMEPRQMRALRNLVGTHSVQGSLLGLWCKRPMPYLPDPYGNPDECFVNVFAHIDTAIAQVSRLLKGARTAQPVAMD